MRSNEYCDLEQARNVRSVITPQGRASRPIIQVFMVYVSRYSHLSLDLLVQIAQMLDCWSVPNYSFPDPISHHAQI